MAIRSVDYEVFGIVQGVGFRAYTARRGKQLGAHGFVQNTARGTVVGTIQGPPEVVDGMKEWLEKRGSPYARIERVAYSNEREIEAIDQPSFEQRRDGAQQKR